MIVRMQNRGHVITGISIGVADARRYFPEGARSIDLELDHLRIRCELNESSMPGCPEISDPRLCAWLEAKLFGKKYASSPGSVEMVKAGDCYRLDLLPADRQARRPGFGLVV